MYVIMYVFMYVGLDNFDEGASPFPWHVHQYPFPHDAQTNPCRGGVTGGHYDPLGANTGPNYAQNCMSNSALCEVGDLSGRLGPIAPSGQRQDTDPVLSLYGTLSIIGRSIVIHYNNGSRLVCANVGYPSSPSDGSVQGGPLLYVPFRNLFTGNMYFRQHTSRFVASVYTDLAHSSNSSASSVGHNWHVHESPVTTISGEMIPGGAGRENCTAAGPHYNPRRVDITSEDYSMYCSPSNQTACEIGDLSGKSSPFQVMGGVVKHFYTDTDLPLSAAEEGAGEESAFSIAGRSVVIHAENRGGPRIACANILPYPSLEGVAVFSAQESSRISGSIRFLQLSPFDPTVVTVDLTGLGGVVRGYHVHENQIGPAVAVLGSPAKCGSAYAGGHWDPLGVSSGGGGVATPTTSEHYEVGDLSGKFGGLQGRNEIDETYLDPNLPLFGPLGILGRSVVIHMDDPQGTRYACADIVHARPVIRVSYIINTTNLTGEVTFLQPTDDPFADTTILVRLQVLGELLPPPQVTSSVVMEATPSPSAALSPSLVLPSPSFTSSSEVQGMRKDSIAH